MRLRTMLSPSKLAFTGLLLALVVTGVYCAAPDEPRNAVSGGETPSATALVFPRCQDSLGEHWAAEVRRAVDVSVSPLGRFGLKSGVVVAARAPGEYWCWFFLSDAALDDAFGRQ